MRHFVPQEKLSKKMRRELNKKKRATWGPLNPVTRKPENPKAYNRKKARSEEDDPSAARFFILARRANAGPYTKIAF